jgi:hypothetical protein
VSAALLATLAGLALVDSTSIGTLFIPVWLLLAPGRVRAGRILGYLATIATFYFGVGLLIVAGVGSVGDTVSAALGGRTGLWLQLALGVGLFTLSFRFDPKRTRTTGRVDRWRERATSGSSSAGWLMGLALLAALAEVATMLPYLGAIGLLATSDVPGWTVAVVLAGYCALMVLPAAVLLAARILARSRVEPLLQRLNAWIAKHAASATGWVLAIVGFLVARDAAFRLWGHLLD